MAWSDSFDSHPLYALPGTASGNVNAVAIQSDGKILIGGTFTLVNNTARSRIARLNDTGETGLDSSFNPATGDVPATTIRAIAIQSNGQILVGGDAAPRLVRLNSDGTPDATFAPAPNGAVRAIAIQDDGKILVCGDFTSIAATTVNRIARLNTDGTIDSSFVAASGRTGFTGSMLALAIQADDMVVMGGSGGSQAIRFDRLLTTGSGIARLWRFNNAAGQPTGYTWLEASGSGYSQQFDVPTAAGTGSGLRLDVDIDGVNDGFINQIRVALGGGSKYGSGYSTGVPSEQVDILAGNNDADVNIIVGSPGFGCDGIDQSFAPQPAGQINAIAIQADGKIIVGGTFTSIGQDSSTHNRLARFNPDGTTDSSFNPSFAQTVNAIAIQSDGKIIVGANTGASLRLNSDGTTDKTFSSTIFSEFTSTPNTGSINCLAIQSDGKIVVGGSFSHPFGSSSTLTILRLRTDCIWDFTFNRGPGFTTAAALQDNGITSINYGVDGLVLEDWSSDFFLDPTVGFTICGWFNRSSVGSNSNSTLFRILGKNRAFDLQLAFSTTSPTLAVTYFDGTTTETIGLSPSNSAWHFYRVWVDPRNLRLHLEVDRAGLIRSTNVFAAISATTALYLIYHVVSGANFSADENPVYRGMLTDEQADMLYNSGAPPAYPNVPGA